MSVTITTRCPGCKRYTNLEVPWEGLEARKAGAKIQDAFPDLPKENREQLITGICPACWDAMRKEER